MRNPYSVLGVEHGASQDEIRSAYRKAVKACHPDLFPGDAAKEARFKDISAAHNLLSDEAKRARFDRGEIDAMGNERPHARRSPFGDFSFARGGRGGGARGAAHGFEDASIFEDLFGRRRGGARPKTRGADVSYKLKVAFLDAVNGADKTVTTADERTLKLTIPPGVKDGQVLRLKGMGLSGIGGGAAGDAMIEIEVEPHPTFRREGADIHLDLDISLPEAVLGAKVSVPTVTGPVTLSVPKGANSGAVLRLKGKGAPTGEGRGDQYVRLRVLLPDKPDDELSAFVAEWAKRHRYNPRRDS